MDAAGPLLRLHQQTSQIIIASPRSRRGAVTLNHGQRDERETKRVGEGGECVFVWVSAGVYMCTCVRLVLMAVLAAFEHHSVSQIDSQVCHFKISP